VFDKKLIKELQELNDVRLVPLYPLCKISLKKIRAQAPKWAEEVRQAKQLSTVEKTNILALLGGFISHRIKQLSLQDINQILGGFKMEDTQVGRDLIGIGIEKGKQQTLLNQLSYKFGKVPEDIINRINSISDEMKLDDLSIKILELTDLNQLKKHLN